MTKLKFVSIVLLSMLLLCSCGQKNDNYTAESGTDSPELQEYNLLSVFDDNVLKSYFDSFDKATFIISDGNEKIVYNGSLADTALSPYSTFKIPSSLIALETKTINKDNSKKKWDGTIDSREVVNQDHDLSSAFENSVVWYFKELARDIGEENMNKYLGIMSYGNKDISGGIDAFWLDSSLKITPLEQVEFIKKLYYNNFQFSEDTINTVKSIMKQKDTEL